MSNDAGNDLLSAVILHTLAVVFVDVRSSHIEVSICGVAYFKVGFGVCFPLCCGWLGMSVSAECDMFGCQLVENCYSIQS